MKKLPIIIDIETKNKFREVVDHKNLGISLVGAYNYNTKKYETFLENELNQLFKILEDSSYIIGFNIKSFDIPILQTYYPGKFSDFLVFDILDDLKEKIGKRYSLNFFGYATLGKKKAGHGLQAVDMYREGKIEELKAYCLKDVELTKELFDYGLEHGEVFYLNEMGKVPVLVEWKKYLSPDSKKETKLTLPF
jgi:DEAD/DEAH box helicase domain-containing protein